MGAKDLFHHAVKTALEKDNWQITADPLVIKIDKNDLFKKLLSCTKLS